jgi:hypothetical protein
MLTEGWDANTVTHILGIRAFGTQLLCEQVIGRASPLMTAVGYKPTSSRPKLRSALPPTADIQAPRPRSEHRPNSPSGQSIPLWTVCIEPGLGARPAGGVLVAAWVTGSG